MSKKCKATDQLREIFLKTHWEWEKVNNPKGFQTGEVWKKWHARNKALDACVKAQQQAKVKNE